MKLFLRYWRDGLIKLFQTRGYGSGQHHWSVSRWMTEAQRFAQEVLGRPLKEESLCALIMLLYSAFGSTAQRSLLPKNQQKIPICKEKMQIYQGLGRNRREKLKLYHTIFANNNKGMRDQFFREEVVQSFWHAVYPLIDLKLCFANKKGVMSPVNPKLIPSFKEITLIMRDEYRLPMPEWWTAMF